MIKESLLALSEHSHIAMLYRCLYVDTHLTIYCSNVAAQCKSA